MDISIEVGRGLLEEVLRFLAFGSSEVDILSRKMKRQNFNTTTTENNELPQNQEAFFCTDAGYVCSDQ